MFQPRRHDVRPRDCWFVGCNEQPTCSGIATVLRHGVAFVVAAMVKTSSVDLYAPTAKRLLAEGSVVPDGSKRKKDPCSKWQRKISFGIIPATLHACEGIIRGDLLSVVVVAGPTAHECSCTRRGS